MTTEAERRRNRERHDELLAEAARNETQAVSAGVEMIRLERLWNAARDRQQSLKDEAKRLRRLAEGYLPAED